MRIPFAAWRSFMPTGIPASGPGSLPSEISRSKRLASSRASSGVGVQKACRMGSRRSIRSSTASTTSTGESSPARMRRASSTASIRNISLFESISRPSFPPIPTAGRLTWKTAALLQFCQSSGNEVRRMSMRLEDIEGLTVGGLLNLVAGHRPEDDALVYADRGLRYSYAEFKEVVDRCARALMALGLKKGDHVAVWGQNVPEWVTLQFATGKAGTVLVTINPAYKAQELRYVLEQSDAAALFLTEGVKDANFVEILAKAVPDLTGPEVEGLPY